MKRKSALIFGAVFLLVFVLGVLVQAQNEQQIPGLPAGINENQIEAANNKVISIGSNIQKLGQQWQATLFSSPVVKGIDSFLQSISIIFRVLIGQNYSLSVSFLATLLIWIFFFVFFSKIFRDFSSFSIWVSIIVALLLTVVMSQIGAIGAMSNFVITLIFGANKPWWMQILIGFGIALAFFVIFILIRSLGKESRLKRKREKEDEEKMKAKSELNIIDTYAKSFSKLGKRR